MPDLIFTYFSVSFIYNGEKREELSGKGPPLSFLFVLTYAA